MMQVTKLTERYFIRTKHVQLDWKRSSEEGKMEKEAVLTLLLLCGSSSSPPTAGVSFNSL